MKTIIGIDISSKTLDICVKKDAVSYHFVISNEVKSIRSFFRKHVAGDALVAMENTGRYNWNLYEVLPSFNCKVYVIPPLHLKKSLGLTRGKNDKIDAGRICSFIEKNHQECQLWQPESKAIKSIKVLLTERNCRIRAKKDLLKLQHGYKELKGLSLDKELDKLNKKLLDALDVQIKGIEQRIEEIIKADESLNTHANLIKTVPGVGKVLCWLLLSKTNGFERFSDGRKMACYCGVVPFEYQSGCSIRKKPRVSMYADKTIKTVLHMAALSAIRLKNDLSLYYLRKVAEGKNKMSVINAIRNKIILRVFAVIKNQKSYEKTLVLS